MKSQKKNCCSDQEQLLKFEPEGQEFGKLLRSLEQFIQTVKSQKQTSALLISLELFLYGNQILA